MPRSFGTFIKVVVVLGALTTLCVGVFLWRSADPQYAAYEFAFHARFHRYDSLIQDAAKRRGIDPMLIKAVAWRESRFRPEKLGLDGERGLMQITDAAAKEWVKSEKIANFVPTDLFDPKVNINAGSWLLARALHRYEGRDDPMPFALAEYNAGRSRVAKWAGENESGNPTNQASGQKFVENIGFSDTKKYVETVQERVRYYHQRQEL